MIINNRFHRIISNFGYRLRALLTTPRWSTEPRWSTSSRRRKIALGKGTSDDPREVDVTRWMTRRLKNKVKQAWKAQTGLLEIRTWKPSRAISKVTLSVIQERCIHIISKSSEHCRVTRCTYPYIWRKLPCPARSSFSRLHWPLGGGHSGPPCPSLQSSLGLRTIPTLFCSHQIRLSHLSYQPVSNF